MPESQTISTSPKPTTKSTKGSSTRPRRRRSTRKMNNAENFAAVEVKRKSAKEEAHYDLAERGESKHRNFEKPDKPDSPGPGGFGEKGKSGSDSLSSLPAEDFRNVWILMLLCRLPFKGLRLTGRFVTGCSCWIGIWKCAVFIEGQVIVWPSWRV